MLALTTRRRVFRFGVRVCPDRADADDAVQEALVKLARRTDVQRDRAVVGWLMAVVRNACRRMWRRLAARRALDDAATDAPSPEALLARRRQIEQVRAAIAALEPAYRDVLVLRDLEGLPGDEVAARLGLSRAAMKSRLHRARALVREALQRFAPDRSIA